MTATTTDSEFESLRQSILAAIAAGPGLPDSEFDSLALRIFRFQRAANPFYARYCEITGQPEPAGWQEIPAVPTSAFKRSRICSFPPEKAVTFFQTSGTTEGESGRHYFSTLELYEAAIIPNFRAHLLPDLPAGGRIPMHILTPPPGEAPHSSLVHMMQVGIREFGAAGSDYYLRQGRLEADKLISALDRSAAHGEPVFLLGTAFAYIFLLEALAERGCPVVPLPPGSRLMETGGFKGRTREVPRPEFYARLAETFSIPLFFIVNEYGMTELSSQFYDVSLAQGRPAAEKSIPAWTRVLAIDPATGRPVPDGERGLLRILDLANLGSLIALQTEDVGICRGERFEVLGRVSTAQPRGCSLAADDALGG